jgi:hypothetical protein
MGATFAPAHGVHARRFDEELVLLDLAGGNYYALDEVGAQIWEALSHGRTPEQIAADLVERYETDLGTLRADVEELTRTLLDRGLLIGAA